MASLNDGSLDMFQIFTPQKKLDIGVSFPVVGSVLGMGLWQ